MTGQVTDLIHRLHLQMDLLSALGLQTFSVSLSSLSVIRSSGSYRPRPRRFLVATVTETSNADSDACVETCFNTGPSAIGANFEIRRRIIAVMIDGGQLWQLRRGTQTSRGN